MNTTNNIRIISGKGNHASEQAPKQPSFVSNFTSWLKKSWITLNDPTRISKNNSPDQLKVGPQTRDRIVDNTIILIGLGLAIVILSILHMATNNKQAFDSYVVTAGLALAGFVFALRYRVAIAKGEKARIDFISKTRKAFARAYRWLVRTLSNAARSLLLIFAVVLAIQFVPGVEEKIPNLYLISSEVGNLFNRFLAFVLEHIS